MDNKFILVASDVHSDSDAFEKLCNIAKNPLCIAFLYAGDLDVENWFIGTELRNRNFTFLPVAGNCDYPYSFISSDLPVPSNYRSCEFNGLRIFMTHGHLFSQPSDAGLENGNFDVVITGHTHIPSIIKENEIVYLNPGSAAKPRGKSEKSYAKIVFTSQGPDFLIERLS